MSARLVGSMIALLDAAVDDHDLERRDTARAVGRRHEALADRPLEGAGEA